MRFVGFNNYWAIFTIFEPKFFPARSTTFLLVFLIARRGRHPARVPARQEPSRPRDLPERLLPPGRAVAGRGRLHLEERDVLPAQGLFSTVLGRTDPATIDWLAISPTCSDSPSGCRRTSRRSSSRWRWRHIGYVMVLYLAGLKSVDPSLREAASIDGCNEWQSFRRVVFPVMQPINVVVAVITVIEALRAFDIVFALKSPRGHEAAVVLVTDNLIGEGGGHVGRGSAYGAFLLLLCLGSSSGIWSTTTARFGLMKRGLTLWPRVYLLGSRRCCGPPDCMCS